MSSIIDKTWLDARIAKTKALIEAYEDAMLALASGAQEYTLDTGQTRQQVKKADVGKLQETLSALENRLATLVARRNGSTTRVLPGW